jgi:hypothetical protein
MPFDPLTAYLPASGNAADADGIDDWFVPGQAPNSARHPNDWIVPWSAETDAFFPDDWIYPDNRNALPPAPAPSMAPPAPSPQPNAANPAVSNRPAPPPDPFAAYWAMIPASRAGAMAWAPPIFLPPNPFSHENIPASAWLTPPPIFLNSPGQSPLPAPAPAPAPTNDLPDFGPHGLLGGIARMLAARATVNDPWDDAGHGLLGAIARLQPAETDAPTSPLDPLNWRASGSDSRPQSPLAANPSDPPPSVGSGGFGSTPVVANSMSGQSFSPGYPSFDASHDLIPPPPTSQLANPVANALFQRTGLTLGDGDQSTPPSVLQSLAAPDLMTSPYASGAATGYPTVSLDPTDRGRIQLAAGDREKIDPEEIFDLSERISTMLRGTTFGKFNQTITCSLFPLSGRRGVPRPRRRSASLSMRTASPNQLSLLRTQPRESRDWFNRSHRSFERCPYCKLLRGRLSREVDM